jgi:hypothetical protein
LPRNSAKLLGLDGSFADAYGMVMTYLNDFSDDELISEIDRRKAQRIQKPSFIDADVNWDEVINLAIEAVEELDRTGEAPDGIEDMILGAVMRALYGDHVWTWWRYRSSVR